MKTFFCDKIYNITMNFEGRFYMKEKILIGGYTRRESAGVYSIILDTEKEELSNLLPFAAIQNPTYLAVSEKNRLYTCAADENGGGIGAFQINTTSTEHLGNVTSTGAPLAHVFIDEKRQLVYGSNYHLGELRVYKIESNGSLTLVDSIKHQGAGPRPEQASAHIHYAGLTPDQRVVTCDLGTDEVTVYNVNEEGLLTLVSLYRAGDGTGARHLVFHPNDKTAFLAGELNSTVEVLSYNAETGKFSLLQTLSTLPDDFTGKNNVGAIRLSSDGNYLYISNRGHDSIAIYKVSPLGTKIHLLGFVSTEGQTPRDFNFSKNEDFLIVANQDSDNLTLFRRSKADGTLTLVQKDVYSPEGTCVLPLH